MRIFSVPFFHAKTRGTSASSTHKQVIENNESLSSLINDNINIVAPMSYKEILVAMADADLVLTDSGGMQKEAYFVSTPCVTLRDETEWPETVDAGANQIVGADTNKIHAAVDQIVQVQVEEELIKLVAAGGRNHDIIWLTRRLFHLKVGSFAEICYLPTVTRE